MTVDPTAPRWEYQIGGCDIWQLAHLCNHMAGYGWEPIQVIDSYPAKTKVPERVDDDNSPLIPALKAVEVLFRRPADWSDE